MNDPTNRSPDPVTDGQSFDVIIIGAAAVGSSIAFFLAEQDAFRGSVLMVEKDPSYRRCATTRSAGALRQQFSTPENIEISKFGASFFRSLNERLAVNGIAPDVSFHEGGYLMMASEKGLPILRQNYELQTSHGADVVLLVPDEIRKRFPWLNVSDLGGAVYGRSGEGWLDPHSLIFALKNKIKALGVAYAPGEVVAIDRVGATLTGVRLADGRRFGAGSVVNAAGPRAAEVAAMAGIEGFPVSSRKRMIFAFRCPEPIAGSPLVVDPGGVYFRPEADEFLCGVSPPEDQDPQCHDYAVDHRIFEEMIWPALAHRVPAFDRVKVGSSWAGHYAVNVHDHNAILGLHPEVDNFYLANGFSGHGLQQAPAVGRAISELITFGSYRTLDLTRFAFERFAAGELVLERNVI